MLPEDLIPVRGLLDKSPFHKEGSDKMYLACDVYGKLEKWKKDGRSVLELGGVGQYGKVCMVYQFAEENFSRVISINLLEMDGRQFLECYKGAAGMGFASGFPKSENPLYDALRMFHPDFTDTEDTVVIVDEIQESAELYHQIRESFHRFRCRFILTGGGYDEYRGNVNHMDLA